MPQQQLKEVLQKFIQKFSDNIDAIILSDKDGVEVCGGYKQEFLDPEKKDQTELACMMYVTVLSQASDHFEKLRKTKAKSLTLFYLQHTIYIENWHNNLFLTIFAKENANLAILYQLTNDLKQVYSELSVAFEQFYK